MTIESLSDWNFLVTSTMHLLLIVELVDLVAIPPFLQNILKYMLNTKKYLQVQNIDHYCSNRITFAPHPKTRFGTMVACSSVKGPAISGELV